MRGSVLTPNGGYLLFFSHASEKFHLIKQKTYFTARKLMKRVSKTFTLTLARIADIIVIILILECEFYLMFAIA